MTSKIQKTDRESVLSNIQKELQGYESKISIKILKALKSMNIKLQKEITSFVNLKIRIAFMKSGLGNQCNLLGEIN